MSPPSAIPEPEIHKMCLQPGLGPDHGGRVYITF